MVSMLRTLSEIDILPVGLRAALKVRDKRANDILGARASDVLLISYPKSGRTWLHVIISRLYTLQHGLDENMLIEGSNLYDLDKAFPRFCLSHMTGIDPNGDRQFQRAIAGKKLILLVRNPIDVAVSTYHHHAGGRINPKKLAVKQYLGQTPVDPASISLADFVSDPRWGVPDTINYLNKWWQFCSGRAECTILRYEDLLSDTAGQMTGISTFLGIDASPPLLSKVIEISRFEALREQEKKGVFKNASMKPRDPANPGSFKVRRGKAGGYKDELSAADAARLEAMINERLDPGLGYET